MTTSNAADNTITVKQTITETVSSAITVGTITVLGGPTCNGLTVPTSGSSITAVPSGSGTTRLLTVTIPAHNNVAVTNAGICSVKIHLTFTTTQNGDPRIDTGGLPAYTNRASPIATNTLLAKAKAQVYHYALWIHSMGPCGPSGKAEGPPNGGGNDIILALGCDFGTSETESPVPTNAAQDSGTISIKETITLPTGATSISNVGSETITAPLANAGITAVSPTISGNVVTVPVQFTTTSGYAVNGPMATSIAAPVTFVGSGTCPSALSISQSGSYSSTAGALSGTISNSFSGTPSSYPCTYTDTISGITLSAGHWATVGSENQQAGTFMHELGHNLNLNHGGPAANSDSSINCKPDYPSVMSYTRQMDTYLTGADYKLDYSHGTLGSLTENNGIVEANGLASTVASNNAFFPPKIVFGTLGQGAGTYQIGAPFGTDQSRTSINWDGDTDGGISGNFQTTQSLDINNMGFIGCNTAGFDSQYFDYNDWASLVYKFRDLGTGNFDGTNYHQHPAPAVIPELRAVDVQAQQKFVVQHNATTEKISVSNHRVPVKDSANTP